MNPNYTLGLAAFYHDSSATLMRDGEILAAAQEERFTRKKHDSGFPTNAVEYCLDRAGIDLKDVDDIVFYDKPLLKFDRLLETYLTYAPKGFSSFCMAMPVWLKEKLFLKDTLKKELNAIGGTKNELPKLFFTEHHQAHAASAFFPSPYEKAAVLCLDGVGEWATTSAWLGEGKSLKPLWQINFPHSLGLLYSAFTYFTGFKVNSGEYKVMGLAPYGEPRFKDLIYQHLLDVKEDGSFRLNMKYFNYATGLTMTNRRFEKLFKIPRRKGESQLEQVHMDLARSVQEVIEEVVMKLAVSLKNETGVDNICLAGGVALNCVSNGKLLANGPFKNVWIQPAAGDAGGSLGAAMSVWHQFHGNERHVKAMDSMKGSYLGPQNSDACIERQLNEFGAKYKKLEDEELLEFVCESLKNEKVVGWCQGPMEFGPRALGGRSILGDPRSPKMQSKLNLKIKYRESFRPFAPSVLSENVSEYFNIDQASPYMLLVAGVKEGRRIPMTEEQKSLFGIEKLHVPRSDIPAITHVDYSARVQTVHRETNPKYHALIEKFKEKTGCSVVVNTSFNVRGEPIVCDAKDSYKCFMRTEMDVLVVENYIILKEEQPSFEDKEKWQEQFTLD